MRFIGWQTKKSNKSTMLVGFFGLPHGLELLERNIHDQNALPNRELAMLGLKGMLSFPFLHWIPSHHGVH